jgi:hypothetical protein
MATYDPIYAPFPPQSSTPTPASDTLRHLTGYDFVTATEVVEHFCNTAEEMTQLWQCLKPGGWLGIMTKRVTAPSAFGQWHYIRDPTHVSFFSDTTFRWLAVQWQAQLELPEKDVALLQKPC